VLFAANIGDAGWATYSIPSDGSSLAPQRLPINPADPAKDAFESVAPALPLAWTANGRLIVAGVRNANADLATLPAEGGTPEDLVRTTYVEDAASVSPDGRWLAYRSTRSSRPEIWVQATTGSAPVRISQNGGREPVWSRDGRELYYLEGNKMIALAVKPSQDFSFDAPTVLFDQPYFHGLGGNTALDALRSYDVAKDGRFIMIPSFVNPTAGGGNAPGIVVVQNWGEELKAVK
jgi:hypothetical protein